MAIDASISDVNLSRNFALVHSLHQIALLAALKGAIEPLLPASRVLVWRAPPPTDHAAKLPVMIAIDTDSHQMKRRHHVPTS